MTCPPPPGCCVFLPHLSKLLVPACRTVRPLPVACALPPPCRAWRSGAAAQCLLAVGVVVVVVAPPPPAPVAHVCTPRRRRWRHGLQRCSTALLQFEAAATLLCGDNMVTRSGGGTNTPAGTRQVMPSLARVLRRRHARNHSTTTRRRRQFFTHSTQTTYLPYHKLPSPWRCQASGCTSLAAARRRGASLRRPYWAARYAASAFARITPPTAPVSRWYNILCVGGAASVRCCGVGCRHCVIEPPYLWCACGGVTATRAGGKHAAVPQAAGHRHRCCCCHHHYALLQCRASGQCRRRVAASGGDKRSGAVLHHAGAVLMPDA